MILSFLFFLVLLSLCSALKAIVLDTTGRWFAQDFAFLFWKYLAYNLQMEAAGIVALPLIFVYNGNKGRQLPKAFYYLFYPIHLLMIAAIAAYIRN
jgi:hypothetical protein